MIRVGLGDRKSRRSHERPGTSALALIVLLGGSAVLHLRRPEFYDRMVPRALPGTARFWTTGSALAELAIAGATALPATRRLGGGLGALLLVAVFPANVVDMRRVLRSSRSTRRAKVASVVRLPFQVPMVALALDVRRRARSCS